MTTEQGAASLHVRLAGGRLRVTHDDGTELLEGPLPAGGWDAIICALCAAAPDARGPMAVVVGVRANWRTS